ncbi:DUF3696 domain-containing protein [Actinoplanes sp. NPDC024001]|uniref:DUF3696 domain-containing protein n=1 Tax=Actinoplanes sp. NPDC024001 TaxID=3154598 RepID=UPI0033F9C74B
MDEAEGRISETAFRLFEAVRGVGVERGVDLLLVLLVANWLRERPSGLREDLAPLVTSISALDQPPRDLESARSALNEATAVHALLPSLINKVLQVPLEDVPATFEWLFGQLAGHDRVAGESDTPVSIARLLAALTVRSGDVVYDPACGNGNALLAAGAAGQGVRVVANDINQRVLSRAVMRLHLQDLDPQWTLGDAFERPGDADVVLAQPPFGVRLTDEQLDQLATGMRTLGGKAPNGDLAWVYLALASLRPGGRAAVVLSRECVGPAHRQTLSHLLARDAVEAIISLPGGAFRHTSIPTAVCLLREPSRTAGERAARVLVVDAESYFVSGRGGTLELPPDAIAALADLLTGYRRDGEVEAPAHVARVMAAGDLDLGERGLVPQAYLPEAAVSHPAPERRLLTETRLANFKAFGADTRVRLAPLTLVYGANSAGKSSIIQALLLLKQSIEEPGLITQGRITDVGGFTGVLHRHAGDQVRLGFTYGAVPGWIPADGTADPARPRELTWTFRTDGNGRGALRSTGFRIGEHTLTFEVGEDPSQDLLEVDFEQVQNVFRELATGSLFYRPDARNRRNRARDRGPELLRRRDRDAAYAVRELQRGRYKRLPVRRSGLMPSAAVLIDVSVRRSATVDIGRVHANRLARLAAGVSAEVRGLLGDLIWLGPLRSAPRRFYDRSSTDPSANDGRHIAIFLLDHASVVDEVNEWLERMEVPYSLKVLPINAGAATSLIGDLVAMVLSDRRSGVDVTPADVGFGISQILPVIVELLTRRESIVLIEQPETHLHPRLQSRLADLFIETVREGGRGNQLIVETHSEHLLLRTQRRIREGVLDAGQVSVVYVDQDADGQTTARQLRLDDEGNFLDEWPDGFFDERLEDLFGGL